MTIDSYELKIGANKDYKFFIELIYHGNECIIIKTSNNQEIRVPRDILEKFIGIIR